MELIMVNSVKLKIILTPSDMQQLDISNETIDRDSVKTRKAFRSILDRAKTETGFDVKHDRIYVQIFPSGDGGCEMFLTRRGKLLPEPNSAASPYLRKKYEFSIDRQKEKYEYIAKSENIDDIISLCVRLRSEGFPGCSTLYFHGDSYYLLLSFSRRTPSFMKDAAVDDDASRFAFISDYASVYFAEELSLSCLDEHAKVIAERNAVEIISESFGGS